MLSGCVGRLLSPHTWVHVVRVVDEQCARLRSHPRADQSGEQRARCLRALVRCEAACLGVLGGEHVARGGREREERGEQRQLRERAPVAEQRNLA